LKPEWSETVHNHKFSASEMDVPWLTIPAMLADNLVRHAQRTAVVDGATRLSYAELKRHMHQVAAGLHARNLGPGDVVAIWAPNCWQKIAAVVACWWSGCTVTPIPARGKILDAMPILQSTRARLLFTCSSPAQGNLAALLANHLSNTNSKVQDLCPDLETIVDFSDDYSHPALEMLHYTQFAMPCLVDDSPPGAQVAGADICEIMFTSGSTGRPKGVLRRHDQVLRNYWFNSLRCGYRTEDRLLAVAEFSHTFGLNGNLLRCLILGATLVIAKNRNPGELAALISAEKVTVVSAPPSLLAALLREREEDNSVCQDLRVASTGSAHIPPALVHELIALGVESVITGYGMTECDVISTTGLSDSADVIATTVGKLEAGLEVQITDEAGLPVPAGAAGELWVRGYAVTPGYLGATEKIEPVTDRHGWLHTGDMGCLTETADLRILGRKKDVITIHGYTLYPAEIENLLSQSGMLKEIAVMGMPHAVAGEICVAFIVPADASRFSLKSLRLWARNNVADYKIPGRFLVMDCIPLNRNGKVDRIALRSSLDV
jgi:HIP---CoA ligase